MSVQPVLYDPARPAVPRQTSPSGPGRPLMSALPLMLRCRSPSHHTSPAEFPDQPRLSHTVVSCGLWFTVLINAQKKKSTSLVEFPTPPPFFLQNRTLGVSVDIVQDGFAKWNEAHLILFVYNLCHKSAGTRLAPAQRFMSCPSPGTSRILNKVGINWGWAEPAGPVNQFNETWIDHLGRHVEK